MTGNCVVDLYKNCPLAMGKNFRVDNIANFCSVMESSQTYGHLNFTDVQYQRISLTMTLKLVGNESLVEEASDRNDNFNYCRIKQTLTSSVEGVQTTRTNTYYFYVAKRKWMSKNCIEVNLKMDTLNTYQSLQWSAKTHITRRHKTRYTYVSQAGNNVSLTPKIDYFSEGLTPALFHMVDKDTLIDANNYSDWYLVYKNRENLTSTTDLSQPVDCLIYTTSQITIPAYSYQNSRPITSLMYQGEQTTYPSADWWHAVYFTFEDNGPAEIVIFEEPDTPPYAPVEVARVTLSATNYALVIYDDAQARFSWEVLSQSGQVLDGGQYVSMTTLRTSQAGTYRYYRVQRALSYAIPRTRANILDKAPIYPDVVTTGHPAFSPQTFSHVDRTDATLIKIIKLPYSPLGTSPSFDNVMPDFMTGNLKLRDVTKAYSGTISHTLTNANQHPTYPLATKIVDAAKIVGVSTGSDLYDYDTKIYHSDFYQRRFVYDSFSFIFKLEDFDAGVIGSASTNFSFKFSVTSTINSRFMFTFTWMDTTKLHRAETDYYNVLVVARNNEMPIFNQQYINYLRSGYNYDVKSKTRTEAFTWAGVGIGLAAGAASGAMAGSMAGPVGTAAGAVVGAIAGGVASIVNAIKTTMDAEANFAKKQEELKRQAASVYGADDVDLMSEYSSNRAKLCTYKVSTDVEKLLKRLFHYYGYATDEYGNPETLWHNRVNFDFIQCEPVFSVSPAEIEIENDIKKQFMEGVTIIHDYGTGGSHLWNFSQTSYNWEKAVYDATSYTPPV